ncbi:phosphotransferase [Neobacillus rhizophilus]|uniref:Aminoglycoside phosphotransferase family protein n=1 Tax=Neobacillus rhizophilus TaxID=2833579 RepID=A0A942YRN2_9BACI|nr:phosphotransferase [Neobacillus rhizophilus]MBS4211018.1 aminoglycoside phosphotransferase family protein [Neobacillus rhizophilus]
MTSKKEINSQWKHYGWEEKFAGVLQKPVTLSEIECLKNSRDKTSVWKLTLNSGSETVPVILKIFQQPLKENHLVEMNMYRKAYPVFQEMMPKMIWLESDVKNGEFWLFTECLEPVRGQIKLRPYHLERMIPTVAKFHALTFKNRLSDKQATLFDSWLPRYESKELTAERIQHIEKTKEYLDLAMQDPDLRKVVEPAYDIIKVILGKGPIFFPEVIEAGQCLIHGDLHIHNICCQDTSDEHNWPVQLIDWESAKYAPCWYDLVVLVELLIDFRGDWQKKEDDIRSRCVDIYNKEMAKYGIVFKEDPVKLLKMNYLQRVLEKRLLNHLRRVLNGEKSLLLKRYLEKIVVWGKELNLY